ncbi:MAG: flavodoxin family protein [Chitinophagaceae bacterium]|nr:MAG: flavodoxin family protein [Chitinophagaceae bacterium]
MKHLIIYCHPSSQSLNHQLKDTVLNALQAQQVQVRDLYQIGFNPVLSQADMEGQRKGIVADDVRTEQDFIADADVLTLIYPIWWTGLPAIMKGYIDRVLSYGFAYRYDQGVQRGLLTGKKVIIINTHGKSDEEYAASGMDTALALTSDAGIYRYCGLDIIDHVYFDRADRATSDMISKWKEQVISLYKF